MEQSPSDRVLEWMRARGFHEPEEWQVDVLRAALDNPTPHVGVGRHG
jgi:hypothetical protein